MRKTFEESKLKQILKSFVQNIHITIYEGSPLMKLKEGVFCLFFLGILGMTILGCSSKMVSYDKSFIDAEEDFSVLFPSQYPPRKIKPSLDDREVLVLANMTRAVSKQLFSSGIKNKASIRKYEVIILPQGTHYLSQMAKKLKLNGVTLKYDGLYFAKNPFSDGTFREKAKEMLISHRTIKNGKILSDVIEHELIHVETYNKMRKKLPSPFYCQFKGQQFAPHYLSCDEMHAYHNDLKRLLKTKTNKSFIQSKLHAAQMHTEPIIQLIKNLEMTEVKILDETVIIAGKNSLGEYSMEFPIYSVKESNLPPLQIARIYTRKVRVKASGVVRVYV